MQKIRKVRAIAYSDRFQIDLMAERIRG